MSIRSLNRECPFPMCRWIFFFSTFCSKTVVLCVMPAMRQKFLYVVFYSGEQELRHVRISLISWSPARLVLGVAAHSVLVQKVLVHSCSRDNKVINRDSSVINRKKTKLLVYSRYKKLWTQITLLLIEKNSNYHR